MWTVLFLALCLSESQGFLVNREDCFGKYGCFDINKPYDNTLGFLPESPSKQGIQFFLYTRKNPTHAHVLHDGNTHSVHSSHFSPHHQTKLIVHGFSDSGHAHWVKDMTSELLKHADMNVIVVNWEKGADSINYYHVAANTRIVGAVAAELLKTLHSGGAHYSNVHVIGHSLGAHIGGYIGERIPGMGRITGLDPAGPLFENYAIQVRLDPSDAHFVDVIHTDAESLLKLGLGMMKAIGDADFYPNGGVDQPGCPAHAGHHFLNLLTGFVPKLTEGASCSHSRALDFFTSSINNHCHYNSHKCSSQRLFDDGLCNSCGAGGCAHMGYHASSHLRGHYYLTTSAHAPYYCCKFIMLDG